MSTPFGETKMPLPTMVPRMRVTPLNSPSVRFSFTVSDGADDDVSLCGVTWLLFIMSGVPLPGDVIM